MITQEDFCTDMTKKKKKKKKKKEIGIFGIRNESP